MSEKWKRSYIKSLDLHEIKDDEIRAEINYMIKEYLKNVDMIDAFKKIVEIQELIKKIRDTDINPSILEAIEHVKGKLEDKSKFGPPTLHQLFEFAPKESNYLVPPVFFEHPQQKKIRILKLVKEKGRDKILETEALDVSQLKIHYIIGNLDRKVVDKEERLAKILCGRVRHDPENNSKYVLLNDIKTRHPHTFDVKEIDGEPYQSPNFVSMRVVPEGIVPRGGVYFCPTCYNLYDDDEIERAYLNKVNLEINTRFSDFDIQNFNEEWLYCPFCTERVLYSTDEEEFTRTLLFSILYPSNLYPDTVPITDRSVKVDKTLGERIENQDKVLNFLIGNPLYSEKGGVGERIRGFTRILDIHPDSMNRPNFPIYRWHRWKLKKGDKNIYYRYKLNGKEIPTQISTDIENTDVLLFNVSNIYDDVLHLIKPSLFLDLIFSSFRLLLNNQFPEANIFILDTACEAILSYYLLSVEMKLLKNQEDVINSVVQCLKELHKEVCMLIEVCLEQEIDFRSDTMPGLLEIIRSLPIELSVFSKKINIVVGDINVSVTRKLALILRLFGAGEKWGNLLISGKKGRPGLDFSLILNAILSETEEVGVDKTLEDHIKEIFLHTLAHLIYRSSIEVSKCDESDVSYDYNTLGEILIYDNYSGGAGFVKECVECFDNLTEELTERPAMGMIQQIEANSGICLNYLCNYLIYETVSSLNLEELRSSTYSDLKNIVNGIKMKFNITDLNYNRIFSKVYGKSVFRWIIMLLKQKYQIVYYLLKKKFDLAYDDLVLVQRCPTIFLFILLCNSDDFEISTLMKEVFKERGFVKQPEQEFSLLQKRWNNIFESTYSGLFSKFNRDYLSIFEDIISACTKGCYDCSHISFGCKHAISEQKFRINTYLTRLAFSAIRKKHHLTFPRDTYELRGIIDKMCEMETSYFSFFLRDFPKIEVILNTFLSQCLTYDVEQCRPLYLFEIQDNDIKVFFKMRRREF